MKEYLTIEGIFRTELEIKHSKFIATASHVQGREQAVDFLSKVTKEFSDATHNCYAYSADTLGMELKFSDNGEPSGTAGQPILDAIKKNNLNQIIIVVTRYFGGIKLGASGLVGAYSSSASSVIKEATIVKMTPSVKLEIICPYTFSKKCENLPNAYDGIVQNREYGMDVKYTALLPIERVKDFKSALADITKGQGIIADLGEEYRKVYL